MTQILSCITTEHDLKHIVLAVVILCLGALSAMVVFHRGQVSANRRALRAWAAASGIVTGLSIWATHFSAMLGYRAGFPLEYDGWVTIVSVLIVSAGFIASGQILVGGMTLTRRLASAVIATAAVGVMHFVGMSALSTSAILEFDRAYVAASIALCGGFFLVTYLFGLSTEHKWRNLIGWLGTILAVASLHFVSNTGLTVIPAPGLREGWAITSGELTLWVEIGVVVIVILAGFAARFDSLLARAKQRESRRLSLLADSANEALIVVSASEVIIEVNTAAVALAGKPREELIGQPVTSAMTLTTTRRPDPLIPGGANETVLEAPDGSSIPVGVSFRKLDQDTAGLGVYSLRDLRAQRTHEAEIQRLAFYDSLTGLPNRAAFHRSLSAALSEVSMSDGTLTVFVVDLDEFKIVNDQYGHAGGDKLLKIVADRLRRVLTSQDMVARLGGDEFAVIVRNRMDEAEVQALAGACIEALSEPVRIGKARINSSASIGVAFAGDSDTADGLMQAADRALYAAKAGGRSRYAVYDQMLHSVHEARLDLEVAMRRALQRGEFELHYQPRVCSITREVKGFEALIRWRRPGHGLVAPDTFIPVAEQSLLINAVGAWTIREACHEAARWREDLMISINISPRQFLDPRLVATFRHAIEKSGIDPSRIEIEVTETVLVENTNLAETVLGDLKAMGMHIALDDFGTGYSSMAYLQRFPFDKIKIDKSFVAEIEDSPRARSIVEAIIHLGHGLAMPLVAEGVETEGQARALLAADCEELQGYLLGRPAPIGDFADITARKQGEDKEKASDRRVA